MITVSSTLEKLLFCLASDGLFEIDIFCHLPLVWPPIQLLAKKIAPFQSANDGESRHVWRKVSFEV
jgi:hypothetical protein